MTTAFAAFVLAGTTVMAAGPARPTAALNLDQRRLSPSEFQAVPDAQVIVFKGQTLTAGEARLKMKLVVDRAHGLQKNAKGTVGPKVAAARKKFLDAQSAALASHNAQGLASFRQRFPASTTAPILKR